MLLRQGIAWPRCFDYADSSIKRLLKVSLEEQIHEGMEANLMKRIFEFLTWMRVEWKWKTIDNVD